MTLDKTVTTLSLLIMGGSFYAQQFPTNGLDAAQAAKLASDLRAGMREEDVAKVMDGRHGLRSGGDIGDNLGWTRLYLLSDGCFLDLQFKPKEIILSKDGRWPGNGLLEFASIHSNGTRLVSISLTNGFQPDGAAKRGQPVHSGTNQPSTAATSGR